MAAREGASPKLTEPLDRAAELARDGVQEARAAVGALRTAPLRTLADLESLVGGFPGNSRLRVTGRPGALAPEAGHAVYRAVQEALTNSARYATGSPVEVNVAWDADEVRVVVRDHGLPAGRGPSGIQGSGSGLSGMSERIGQAGGTVAAGPAPDGPGWRVALSMPASAPTGAPLVPEGAPDTAADGTAGGTSREAGGSGGKMGA